MMMAREENSSGPREMNGSNGSVLVQAVDRLGPMSARIMMSFCEMRGVILEEERLDLQLMYPIERERCLEEECCCIIIGES
jgi:hypothetical protein